MLGSLRRLFHREEIAPPPREHDPELPAARIHTARVLAKADRALERRARLDAELDRVGGVLRSR